MLKTSILFFLLSFPALAQFRESADPSALGFEGSILTVMPPLQFAVDTRLRKNVEFWIRVYSQYTSKEGLIHDAKYVDHVYEAIDFRKESERNGRVVKKHKLRWKTILLSVHQKQKTPEKMTEIEKKIFDLYADIDEPNKFLNAAHRKRLRFQLGQKDRFLDGLYQSGRYLPVMEEIFKREGMPVELTRLPFVESSFNIRARSKVGASGIWQFMRSTARLFIKTNEALDERNDPIRATEGAARLLRLNYESLKSWPLAVTAYNHGRKGMMRAVRRVGSEDLEELVSEYHSRSFGFASSNFFTELLAAIEVEKNAEKYFGKVERAKPPEYFEVKIPDYIEIRELVQRFKLDMKMVKDLNPGLTEAVYSGHLYFPAGYSLRIPRVPELDQELAQKKFLEEYAQIPESLKLRAQRATKYGTRGKSVKRHFKNRTSSHSLRDVLVAWE